MTQGLGAAWSVLREPLTAIPFSQMKEAAAAAGLDTAELSHLRQTSAGRSTSKAELADAIDGLFKKLDRDRQDRVAANMLAELIRRSPSEQHRERLEELLERVGWHLIGDEPAPLTLQLDAPLDTMPKPVRGAVAKALRRYRDCDFDGAMTAIVGAVDTITAEIFATNGLPNHKSASYQRRAIAAHATLEAQFRRRLGTMPAKEADLAWGGHQRAVNGAADVLGAFRRNFSDAHGVGTADAQLVQTALQSALFVINCLAD
jgi:hypothetical protein